MSEIEFGKEINKVNTSIEGLDLYDMPVHGDERGWFKENWQREKMTKIGLPDFNPVQNNMSFNDERGVTRGLHAEPWDKFISIGTGSVFGVWCDLRENSSTYGNVYTTTLDPSKAIFVPRGVANGFQTLEDKTLYTYLVNDHWSPDAEYSNVSIYDNGLNISWPIPLEEATISDKDKLHPVLSEAKSVSDKKILITGANGQLGKALGVAFPQAELATHDDLDITKDMSKSRNWSDYKVIINAAAYTNVDEAETKDGRKKSWNTNSKAVSNLAKVACEHNIVLVHISSDYVYDGTNKIHSEDEDMTPINVYGQTKAAGDISASTSPKHYIVRTSWVVGDGQNFVKTMQNLANKSIHPSVVNDQIGRLSFTKDISDGIKFLLDNDARYGTYNMSNDGDCSSWSDIAEYVYELSGKPSDYVTSISTDEYYKDKNNIAVRPKNSTLALDKIKLLGFYPRDWRVALEEYLKEEGKK